MGEAKRRRVAMAAGRPWPEDLPKPDSHAGQYLGEDGTWHPCGYSARQRSSDSRAIALLAMMAGMGSIKQRYP